MESPTPLKSSSPGCCGGHGKWRGVLAVCGGMLVHLSLGTLYTFGNLTPYLTSYLRKEGSSPHLTIIDSSWIYAVQCMCQGFSMFLGGLLEARVGPRMATLAGAWFMSLGVLLTYLSVKQSFELTLVTYGFMYGLGVGVAYSPPLKCAMKWFPERKGLVNGLVVTGFGGGAFIFNQVQTAYINPDNLTPESGSGDEKYFSNPGLLSRVPNVFLILGGTYVVMQLLGSSVLVNPPDPQVIPMREENENKPIMHSPPSYQDSAIGVVNKRPVEIESEPILAMESDNSFRPLQMLRNKNFYIIWVTFFCNGMGTVFISPLYKAYGQLFIKDDTFLSLTGSFASIFNALGRIFWGMIADRLSCRMALILMTASFTCLMLTFSVTSVVGKSLFFIYVCLLFGSFSGSYSVFPTATAKAFGPLHVAINYGVMFASQIAVAPVGVFLSSSLKSSIGWEGLFFLVSGFTFVSFLLNMVFKITDVSGREV